MVKVDVTLNDVLTLTLAAIDAKQKGDSSQEKWLTDLARRVADAVRTEEQNKRG